MKKITILPFIFSCFFFLFFPFQIVQAVSLFIILLYIWAFALSRYLYHSISVSRDEMVYHCKNGTIEKTSFSVWNKGFIALDNAILIDRGSGCYSSSSGVFMDTLFSRRRQQYSSDLITSNRGRHKVGPIVLKGSDPFNFFPWEKTFSLYSDVIIYPAYHPLQLVLKEGERGGFQKIKDPLYEDLTDLKAIREFRQGDSLKRINWKVTAKSGVLQTMEFSDSLSAPILVLLDISPSAYPVKYRYLNIERAIEAAASLITTFGGKGEKCSLLVKGVDKDVYVPPGKGYGHIITILEELAILSFSEEQQKKSIVTELYQKGINPVTGTHLYLLVPQVGDDLLQEMALLHRRKCYLKLVLTGGESSGKIPDFCTFYTLSGYGREYLDG